VTSAAEAKSVHAGHVLRGEERRRSRRVLIRIRVVLEFASAGESVTIEATTESVNDFGAMLICSRSLAAETQLHVIQERTKQRLLCRVTRAPVESAEGFLIPVEFADSAPGFWGISFPPAHSKPLDE
jgi:hypothetical protein